MILKNLKNVLNTGAAGGLGAVTIEALLTAGYTVTGAMRDAGVQKAAAIIGSINVLINNAGLEPEEFRRIYWDDWK